MSYCRLYNSEVKSHTGCGTTHRPQRQELQQRRRSCRPRRRLLSPQLLMRARKWPLQRLRLLRLRCDMHLNCAVPGKMAG